jgi:deazaflavin-dependent oxidoreductase (nitroreductase family)
VRLPEALFSVINPLVRTLLRSPIHGFWSKSLMLITFTGRRSGRVFTTPVRYVRVGDGVRCFTSAEGLWWRNLREGADITLRIEGKDRPFHAIPMDRDPVRVREALEQYLALFPQDAAYHGIRLNKDKTPIVADLDRASHEAIVVEARPRG